ncbi:hypothetical protein Ancab_023187 [Ancistrocladus abbreviatus]
MPLNPSPSFSFLSLQAVIRTVMDNGTSQENQQISQILEALSKASEDLQSKSLYIQVDINSSAIKAFLELENQSNAVLSQYPDLFKLSQHLAHLKTIINKLKSCQDYSFGSFICRRSSGYQITRIASLISKEIRLLLDRESIEVLVEVLQESLDEEEKMKVLEHFEARLSRGFDRELQDLILELKVFPLLESCLCDTTCSTVVREKSAVVIAALARFNKDVFVGLVLMGFTIRALVLMGTSCSLQVLTSLIKLIKGHLVDEMEVNGEIPRIVTPLSSEDLLLRATAMDCILEMAYFGRKGVIKTMLECGLVEKLVCLQRLEIEGDANGSHQVDQRAGSGNCGQLEKEMESKEEKMLKTQPFAGCIARFAVHVEVGEGTEKSEKKEIKMEILRRAREASVSEAEAATIVAEVLWGSSP